MHHPTFLAAAVTALLPLSASAAFSDVPSSHPHAAAIAYVQAEGIVSGYPDGTFRPDATINRAELAKIIIEAAFDPEGRSACFPDVRTEWFADYVCTALELGIVSGYPDGSFKPENTVSFVEAAKMISIGWQLPLPRIGGNWYAQFVMALESENAIPRDIRAFDAPLTRGQMAEIIHRLHAGIDSLPSKTYAELSGDMTGRASSQTASSRPASSRAASKAAAQAGFPVTLTLTSAWQTEWEIQPIQGTTESMTNVSVVHEDGSTPADFLRVQFPKGSGNRFIWVNYAKPLGGMYAWLDPEITPSRDLRFRYWVRFPEGFDFHRGGSLPGIFTGITNGRDEESTGAVWLAWEKEGKIAVNGRFSDKDQRVSNYLPGADVFLADGKWHKIDVRVSLNSDPTRYNGVIEVWHDDEKVAGAESVLFPARTGDLWDGVTLWASMGTMDLASISPKDQHVDLGGFTFSDKRLP